MSNFNEVSEQVRISNKEFSKNLKCGVDENGLNTSEVMKEYHNCNHTQSDLDFYGATKGSNYYASKIENNPVARKEKLSAAKKEFKEMLIKDEKELSANEMSIKKAYNAFVKGELDNYIKESPVMDNSAEAPTSLGGTAYFMPVLAKMLGETFTLETSLGTIATVKGSRKHFMINDYLTAKTNTSFEYSQYVAFVVESKPTYFNSYKEIKSRLSNQPGSQTPENDFNNYDYTQEPRMMKNYSFSLAVQYNEMQVAQLKGFQGINQIAWKQEMAQKIFDELYYYNGVYDLFYNPAFTVSKADRVTARTLSSSDLLVMSGMVDSSGKLVMNFSDVVDKASAGSGINDIVKFCTAFKTYCESYYGNNTMLDPVLVLPLTVFNKWNATPIANSGNLNGFFGRATFLEHFEYSTGIKVMPLNLLDPLWSTNFGGLSLSTANVEDAFLYDKSQFHYITTKNFAQFNTWGTANNVDYTTVYEGELCPVFNPWYNANMNSQTIPAIHFKLGEEAITLRNKREEKEMLKDAKQDIVDNAKKQLKK